MHGAMHGAVHGAVHRAVHGAMHGAMHGTPEVLYVCISGGACNLVLVDPSFN